MSETNRTKKVVALAPCEIRVTMRGLAGAFQKLHKAGQLLADAAGNPVFCAGCQRPIFRCEHFISESTESDITRFWCEQCAERKQP